MTEISEISRQLDFSQKGFENVELVVGWGWVGMFGCGWVWPFLGWGTKNLDIGFKA